MDDESLHLPFDVDHSLQSAHCEDELRELYNQMTRVAYSKVSNKSDAQDAVQEAWVRMLTKHHTLRERSKLISWAKTITANVALNLNRASRRRSHSSSYCDDAPDEVKVCSHDMPKDEAQLMLEISEMLGELDPRTRTMLLYKFYYGLKDQEIADAMKVPVGTIKARIHRTKIQLKKTMGESGTMPG
ncbi:RNA polymerase sigma factor [Paenibacillus baekrokdamisoli]|uniref:RNA polymerase sigma factor n=1 Tax=Paenibacillus baekrokdamisoli TaxID=1712516 RepID=A0A3G9JF65_9BACL|nr:RNA polymerase sigma factor [Paenibacillus baekrokdamisoli]MBB3071190.1 RNA polymerase sigma-70 factor (ECF subfamily) [Paenibacillus baekrokdamisoli]BBH21609.1 RNA polymerase sigma factor [Paenibacillus baekrokdamisoli]